MNKVSERQIGYLAAMVDGEGMIGLGRVRPKPNFKGYKDSYVPKIAVYNTNKTVLIWCRDVTGIGTVKPLYEGTEKHKPSHHWELRINEMIDFLNIIQPALIIKWEQADYLLEYLKLEKFNRYNQITEEAAFQRKILFEILRDLNKRGL